MALVIKNTDSVSNVYAGQTIEPAASYTVQDIERYSWATSDLLIEHIAIGKAQVNDGISDIAGVSNQISYLKQLDLTPRDSDGSPLNRTKITQSGWHYQLHGLEFETSVLSSEFSKKADNSNYGFTSMKFYKLDGSSEVEITGGDLNQTFLDSNCVKTIVDWEPNHDIELIGALLKIASIPTEDIRMWAIGVPDVPEAYGGSKPFATNINIRYLGLEEGVRVDGRVSKLMVYSASYHTSKMRLIFRHPTGFKHKFHMIFELFKA